MENKGEQGREIRAVELWLQHLFCQEFFLLLVQEEEDTGGGRGGCDYYSVPAVKKNDVHVMVSCLLQQLMGCFYVSSAS